VSTYLEEEYCKCGYKPRREEVRLHTWKRRKFKPHTWERRKGGTYCIWKRIK
jgi:hypothetical protein